MKRPAGFAVDRKLVASAGVLALVADLIVGRGGSGIAATVGIGLVVAAIGAGFRRTGPSLWASLRTWPLWRAVVLLAAVGFAVARARVAVGQLGGSADPEVLMRVARRYDGIAGALLVLAAFLGWHAEHPLPLVVRMVRRPASVLAGSFAGMIAVGTILLVLPFSVTAWENVSLVDALFTMTSAVCVTGLAVNDIGTAYTLAGQVVILLGVQLGGIGIMTIAALALGARGDMSLAEEARYAAMLETGGLGELRRTVRSVVTYTLVIEAVGAGLLAWSWSGDDVRLATRSVAFAAVFHAVSAFCNAGFSLFPTGLAGFRGDFGVLGVVMALIVAGGIGFPVLGELVGRARGWLARIAGAPARAPRRLTLGTRTVLLTSALLIVGGAIGIGALEARHMMSSLPFKEAVLMPLFASVSARTAGFNTVDIGALQPATLLLTMVLMFIGGSPASCAGGIKTTTTAVIVAALVAELRGREPELGGRALPPETLRRSVAVTASGFFIVTGLLLLLCVTETHGFLAISFETVSAFATTGLTTGITPTVSDAGKLVLSAAMFLGRVGPLTVALVVGRDLVRRPYALARENLPVG